jgi:gliding motility-associated lipoprotein GldB
MKKHFLCISLLLLLFSCKKEDALLEKVVEKSVDLEIERFEQQFFQLTPEKLKDLKIKYPKLFPSEITEKELLEKSTNTFYTALRKEVNNKFKDFTAVEDNLEMLVSRIQNFFPEEKKPRVITLINDLIIDKKAFYTNDEIIISLDCYLGKTNEAYKGFEFYQRETLEPNQILPDLVTNFAYRKIKPSQDKSLVSEMIYFGKLHYLKDVLIPETAAHEKIGYSKTKYDWCVANEEQIWSYLVSEKLLYNSNIKNYQRFIEDGPYTKFYKEIDQESPGKIGQWIGWQIVKSYMQNNEVTLEQLLTTEPSLIFSQSQYKPRK